MGLLLGALLLGAMAVGAFVVLGPSFTTARRATSAVDTAAAMGGAAGDVVADAADSAADPALVDSTPAPPSGGATTVFLSDSAGGDAVYRGAGRCLSCHGAAGEGVQNLGPSLRDAEWLQGDGSRTAVEHVVAAGVSPPRVFPIAMPAYADQLSPEQIRLVAAYVFTLSHPGSVVPDSLGLPADTAVRRDTLPRRR